MSASLPESAPLPAPMATPSQRIEEEHPDQHPPKPTAHRAGRGEIHRLVELHLALRVARHDDRVLHFDQILRLQFRECRAHLERVGFVVKSNDDQVAHAGILRHPASPRLSDLGPMWRSLSRSEGAMDDLAGGVSHRIEQTRPAPEGRWKRTQLRRPTGAKSVCRGSVVPLRSTTG